VKSPEDRLALEKEIPSLIAARDKAVTAALRFRFMAERGEFPKEPSMAKKAGCQHSGSLKYVDPGAF
jgi:hypothetical protein